MTFVINGLDIMPFVADGGIDWQRKDVEGPAAGTAINGRPIRDKRAELYSWTLTCMPLTAAQLATVLSAISPSSIQATYTDPETNALETDYQAFADTSGIQLKRETQNGIEYFSGLSFPVTTFKAG